MTNSIRSARPLLSGAAALLLCFSAQGRAEAEPARFGFISEFSGPGTENGESCRVGIETARRAFPVEPAPEFIYGDHRGDAKSGLLEFSKLVTSDRVSAVFSTRSQVLMPMIPLADSRGIPLLGSAGHAEFVRRGKLSFRFFPSVEQEGDALVKIVSESGAKKVAVIALEDEWTVSLADRFKETAKSKGLSVVLDESVAAASAPDAVQLSTKLRRSGADALFLALGNGSIGMYLRKVREQGFKGLVVTNFWVANRGEIEAAGVEAAEGVRFIEINTEKPKFRAIADEIASGRRLTALSYACYAAAAALLDITRREEEAPSSQVIAKALSEDREIPLLDENLVIRGREALFDVRAKVIRGGVARLIE